MLTSAILEAWTSEFALATVTNRNVKQPIISLSETPYAALDIANDNPRSLEEELLARLAAAQRELSLVSMHLTANFREGTMRQIRQLLVPEFWDEEDAHLNMVSFRSFARAMAALRPAIRPMLGLSDRGHILAMWGSEATRLSFEHLENDELRWSIFNKDVNGRDTAAGTTSVARISRIIDAHGVGELLHGAR